MTKPVLPFSAAETLPLAVCTVTAVAVIATTEPRRRTGAADAAVASESPAVAARVSPRSRFMLWCVLVMGRFRAFRGTEPELRLAI